MTTKKCTKCGFVKTMANNQFRCAECSKKFCIICEKPFYVPLSEDKRKCCSKKCMYVLQSRKKYTPEQKLKHTMVMRKSFLSRRIEGLRKCWKCGLQKPESDFSRKKSNLKNTGLCKKCKRTMSSMDYFKHHEARLKAYRQAMKDPIRHAKIRQTNIISNSKRRTGLNRFETIFPHTQCYVCGITQEDHLEKVKTARGTGIGLSIHHIDNNGRRAMAMGFKPNNSPDNLMILCSADHTRQHNHERDYTGNGFKVWKTRRKKLILKMIS